MVWSNKTNIHILQRKTSLFLLIKMTTASHLGWILTARFQTQFVYNLLLLPYVDHPNLDTIEWLISSIYNSTPKVVSNKEDKNESPISWTFSQHYYIRTHTHLDHPYGQINTCTQPFVYSNILIYTLIHTQHTYSWYAYTRTHVNMPRFIHTYNIYIYIYIYIYAHGHLAILHICTHTYISNYI